MYSLHVSSAFGWKDGFNVNRNHIFPHGVLAALTLVGSEAGDEGARAGAM